MAMMNHSNSDDKKQRILLRVAICAAILFVGIGGLVSLAALKKPPAEAEDGERPLRVRVRKVAAQSIPVTIAGFGQVRTLNSVNISAQVAGQVIGVHPRLEVGEVMNQGDLLFEIDHRDYASARDQSRAEVARLTSAVERLEKQAAIDRDRLRTLRRNRELAEAEFDRVDRLFTENQVGTRSGVDRAEQAFNAAVDQADQMGQAVALYPLQIKEARASLAAARARLGLAGANLERCRVTAPFTGRLTAAAVEQGQYVSPGPVLVTLADDTMLEIQVPLDSRDVREWLQFEAEPPSTPEAWFGKPKAVDCHIRWTEDKPGHGWTGRLQRVVAVDRKTRTVTVAVRVSAEASRSENGDLPLVEGMFCEVEIPGRTLSQAFQVPRAAVGFDNTVYMAVDRRLKTVDVQVARIDGDVAYITGGLQEGDAVIITRLVDPLENALLEIVPDDRS